MTVLRRLAPAICTLLLIMNAVPQFTPKAASDDAGTITIAADTSQEHDYPGIPVPDPSGQFADPGNCPTIPACRLFRVNLGPLPAGADPEESFLKMSLSWSTQKVENAVTSEQGTVDLDLYTFAIDKDGDGKWVSAGKAADQFEPENLSIFKPNSSYWIIVYGSLGTNDAYHLSLTYSSANFTTPFEAIQTSPHRPPNVTDQPVTAPPPDNSFIAPSPVGSGTLTASPPAVAAAPAPAALAPVAPDEQFGATAFSTTGNDAALAAPTANAFVARRAAEIKPGRPPSGLILIFWFVLVPLLLGGAVAFGFRRTRPVALLLE